MGSDPVSLALNLRGDQALQGLYGGIGLGSLVASAVIVIVWGLFKKPQWGIGTGVFVVVGVYFLIVGLIAPVVTSFSSGSGTISLTGNGKFRSVLSLAGIGQAQALGALIVSVLLVILFAKKLKWGKGVAILMIVTLPILYLHWVLPFWASTGINVGSVDIPFIS